MAKKGSPFVHPDDIVRAQVDPRALEILDLVGVDVPSGYVYGIKPNFQGVPTEAWDELYRNHPQEYAEIIGICEGDFPTWCALLAKVTGKGGGGSHPFIFNNAQRYLWNRFYKRIIAKLPLFFIVLKSRQLGITTFMAAWQYWQLWRQSNIQTLMLGHIDLLAGRIMTIMRVFHDELPDVGDIKPRLRQDTKLKTARVPKGEIYLTRRGDISWNSWGIAGSARNIDQRGFQGSHFSGSEGAFWPKFNALKDALLPQLPPPSSPRYLDCSVIFESSPQGQNEFYDFYQLGKVPMSKWESVFLPYIIQDDEFAMPVPEDWKPDAEDRKALRDLTIERKKYDGKPFTMEQLYWRSFTIANDFDGEIEAFDAEYASDDVTCFMLSKHMLFQHDMRYLRENVNRAAEEAPRLLDEAGFVKGKNAVGVFQFEPLSNPFFNASWIKKQKPKFVYNRKGNVTIWEPPTHGHHYVIGADGSGGQNNRDGSCAHVCCVTCGRQAAEFWDNSVDPDEFTDQFYHLALMYNEALVNPEVNYLGTIILKRLMGSWGYGNVAREEKWDEMTLKPHKYGFMTHEKNKEVMIAAGISMIKARHYRISGEALLAEMSTFQFDGYTSRGYEMHSAKGNKHDDRVIAYCLAMYAVRQSPKHFLDMSKHEHAMPTAIELRINRSAPQVENLRMPRSFTDELPTELRNIFDEGGVDAGMPPNPIKGYLSGWR